MCGVISIKKLVTPVPGGLALYNSLGENVGAGSYNIIGSGAALGRYNTTGEYVGWSDY